MKTKSLKIGALAIALGAFGLVAFVTIHAPTRSALQAGANRPATLTPAMFTDCEFTLISDKDYLYYSFREGGSVTETFGQKALVGLEEGWRIEHGNTLVFTGVPDGIGAVPNPVR